MIWSHQDCKSSQISSSKNTVVQRHTSSMGRNSSNWLYGPEPAQPAANASSRESSVDLFSPEAMLSGGAACMSHIIHHPLYTLKSQMMFHGHNFRFGSFLKQARSPTWLYSGERVYTHSITVGSIGKTYTYLIRFVKATWHA